MAQRATLRALVDIPALPNVQQSLGALVDYIYFYTQPGKAYLM
jgi:hypothetical protein